tara:strand:- start:1161 stop:1859 length:699 start_codon:yes stop_codon:yes gene_type:complete
MAVNKNFVVKNGLEVNTSLIVANAETQRVGIASTVPQHTLDVSGGIGATDLYVTGVGTFLNDVFVGGNLNVTGDLTYDEVNGRNLRITGLSTFVGISTFEDDVYMAGNLNVIGDLVYDEVTGRNINISGLSTFVGISTFKSDVFIDGDLNVIGDIVYDEVSGRNLNITGIGTIANLDAGNLNVTGLSTFVGFSTFNSDVYVAGVMTATTYYGDGSGLINAGTSLGMVIALGG